MHRFFADFIPWPGLPFPPRSIGPLTRIALSTPPVLTLTASPPSLVGPPQWGVPGPVTLTATGLPAGTAAMVHFFDGETDLGPADSIVDGTAVKSARLAPDVAEHALVAVLTTTDGTRVPATSQALTYRSARCTCSAGGDVQVAANNETPPFEGSLSLSVAAGTEVHLRQLDPAAPGGHPAQGTDPTGHRHAWVFTGTLTGVTVVDTRPQGNGWTVTGQAAPFVNGATTIPAENVGWTLHADRSGQYAEGDIRPGPPVSPRLQSGDGSGLAQSAIFAFAASQFLQPPSGFGSQDLSADLHLWMPDTAPTGLYTSTLTLTLISP